MRCSGGSRGGARGPALPPLNIFLEQTEARRAEKKNFWRPPPLSQGLDEPPPPLYEGLDLPLRCLVYPECHVYKFGRQKKLHATN